MLNIRRSGLGSTVAVASALVYLVDPVVPFYDSEFAALNVAFADGDGRGDFP